METIKDPKTNNECNGYVIVTKVGNIYDYTPHLNCISDIGSSGDDGLLLHYKFDDFQEPTENLLPNGDFIHNKTGWNNNQNVFSTVIDYLDKKFIEVTSNQATSTPGIISTWITIDSDTEYTLSLSGQCLSKNAYIYIAGNTTGALVWTGPRLAEEVSDLSITFNTKINTSIRVGILFSGVKEGDIFVVANLQLEKKRIKLPLLMVKEAGLLKIIQEIIIMLNYNWIVHLNGLLMKKGMELMNLMARLMLFHQVVLV